MSEVSNREPTPNTALRANDAIVFDVTPSGELRLESFTVLYADLTREALWATGAFGPQYKRSTVASLGDGIYRFTVRRLGGWPRTFTIESPDDVEGPVLWRFGDPWGGFE